MRAVLNSGSRIGRCTERHKALHVKALPRLYIAIVRNRKTTGRHFQTLGTIPDDSGMVAENCHTLPLQKGHIYVGALVSKHHRKTLGSGCGIS